MSSRNFIVVEQDDDLRAIYRFRLEKQFQGCTVIEAPSCCEALAALDASAVDAVLINQKTLDGSGIEALRRIREANATIPLISIGPVAVQQTALKSGATAFLDDRRWDELGPTVEKFLS